MIRTPLRSKSKKAVYGLPVFKGRSVDGLFHFLTVHIGGYASFEYNCRKKKTKREEFLEMRPSSVAAFAAPHFLSLSFPPFSSALTISEAELTPYAAL